ESLPGPPVLSDALVRNLEEIEALRSQSWLSPPDEKRLSGLQREAARELSRLGERVALARPEWATRALGEVPLSSATARSTWTDAAGRLAAHRALRGIALDDPKPL